jgi:hypothetical protein
VSARNVLELDPGAPGSRADVRELGRSGLADWFSQARPGAVDFENEINPTPFSETRREHRGGFFLSHRTRLFR